METKKLRIHELLKNRNYMFFWLSSTFSMAASNLIQFVLALYILDLTGSATIFASILSIIVIPRICLTPLAGVIGDKYSRIKTMSLITISSTIMLSIFTLISYQNKGLLLWHIYVLVVALEIIEVFYQAPESAIIPELVKPSLLKEALSLSKIDDGIVYVLYPVIGAIVYKQFGLTGGLVLATIFFAIASILRVFIKPQYENKKKVTHNSIFKNFSDGFNIIKNNDFLYKFLLVSPIFSMFFSAVFSVTILYIFLEVYKIGEHLYALYRSISASMVIIVPILVVPIVKKYPINKIIVKSSAIISLCLLSIATLVFMKFKFPQINMVILFTLITLFDCISVAAAMPMQMSHAVLLHEQIPDKYKSRVLSVSRMFTMTALPIGNLLFGWLTDTFPVYLPTFISALGTGVCYMILRKLFKDIPSANKDL